MPMPTDEEWEKWEEYLYRRFRVIIRKKGLAGLHADIQEAAKNLMMTDKEIHHWVLSLKLEFNEYIEFGNKLAEYARSAMMEQHLLERS